MPYLAPLSAMFWLSLSAMLDFSNSHKILLRKKLKRGVFSPVMHKYTKWKQRRWYLCRVYEILVNIWACVFNKSWKHPWFVIKPLWGRQRASLRLSKSLFEDVIKALSFCHLGLMGKWINIRAKVHIYTTVRDKNLRTEDDADRANTRYQASLTSSTAYV